MTASLRGPSLRLLHVVPTYLPALRYGGPIRSVHALCRALAAQGHETDVFTTSVDGPGNSDVPLGRPVELEGVKVTYFPSPILRRLYWSPAMRRALLDRVADYDLVHVHAIYLWPTWMAARAARRRGVPYVVSPRGMLVPELIRRKNRWVKEAWIRLIERPNLEHAAAVHTTSAIEARHLASFGWRLRRVVTIPHGVDDPPLPTRQALSPDISAAIAGAPPILAFGRISWEKGLDRLLEALPRVPNARLVIAGDDGGHAATLAEKARLFRVDERVTIIARQVGGADKEALFAAAALFAMTSLSENFGLAAFEAMRRRLPVLTVPDVGMSEIVRHARAGAVVDPSPEGIAGGLDALLADGPASRAMGQRGYESVVAEYGWDAIATRMSALYRSVIGENRRA
ncbi:glycosyltransferase [Reyranella sp.]|uniref:glycosyltransferase n=1 Tax=Reyranella sp. TaxID=1929291 RepID=UPI003D14D15B